MQLNETSLLANDLRDLVHHVFEVDSYKSKMGEDKDIVVLSFIVNGKDPANDLVEFIEKGYKFVLDADATPGELSDGKYRVFVELERNRHIAENISDMLYGIGKLSGLENFKFRYHKSFNSMDAVKETLAEVIPNSALDYEQKINERKTESYEGFFSKSMLENLSYDGEVLKVKKIYAEPLKFRFLNAGKKDSVMETISDKVNVDGWPEVIFLTKYFGDYNITKYGNKLIFDDSGYAVVLERIQ
jgi:hypothetical protein